MELPRRILRLSLIHILGWQVYQSYAGLEIGNDKKIGKYFINISQETFDINTPEDYLKSFGSIGRQNEY